MTIGQVAERADIAPSALRFYADQGLISSTRAPSGHRRFERSVLRRLAFIKTSQTLGYSLDEIAVLLADLPTERGPDEGDWAEIATGFAHDLNRRIAALEALRDRLTACIGCGCLSLSRCELYNPGDKARSAGPGARYLLAATEGASFPATDA